MTLYNIIHSLKITSGKNAKINILEANKDNKLLQAFLKATLDPSISYYQKKCPKPTKVGHVEFVRRGLDLNAVKNVLH